MHLDALVYYTVGVASFPGYPSLIPSLSLLPSFSPHIQCVKKAVEYIETGNETKATLCGGLGMRLLQWEGLAELST